MFSCILNFFVVSSLNEFYLIDDDSRAPSASRIRAKMLYATSKDGLRRVLDGIHYELQATDPTEMGFEIIRDRAK